MGLPQEGLKEFPEGIIEVCTTPASNHLFKVREEDGRKLSEELADAFHLTVY